jgi:hypothetical protein
VRERSAKPAAAGAPDSAFGTGIFEEPAAPAPKRAKKPEPEPEPAKREPAVTESKPAAPEEPAGGGFGAGI